MGKKLPDYVANRLYTNVFVCMKCNAKLRSTPEKVKRGKSKCRKCHSKALRLKAKEKRGAKT